MPRAISERLGGELQEQERRRQERETEARNRWAAREAEDMRQAMAAAAKAEWRAQRRLQEDIAALKIQANFRGRIAKQATAPALAQHRLHLAEQQRQRVLDAKRIDEMSREPQRFPSAAARQVTLTTLIPTVTPPTTPSKNHARSC